MWSVTGPRNTEKGQTETTLVLATLSKVYMRGSGNTEDKGVAFWCC